MAKNVPVVEDIMSANKKTAFENRSRFDEAGLFAINLMASPGAGKTSVITETVKGLKNECKIAYIDGDVATSIDADKVAALDIPAVQINTGGQCHLDAIMIKNALPNLKLQDIDLLLVENVGNLICPTGFHLGVHRNVLIASVPEGDDKPYKYPGMYQGVDSMLLNKMDVIEAFDFRMDYFKQGVEILNPGLSFFPVSCKTGEGILDWLVWIRTEIKEFRTTRGKGYEIR
jgi:hydrogenase nickel incorporation protein HypB